MENEHKMFHNDYLQQQFLKTPPPPAISVHYIHLLHTSSGIIIKLKLAANARFRRFPTKAFTSYLTRLT